MIQERMEHARAEMAAAQDFFDYATGKYVDTAIYNMLSKESSLINIILEEQEARKKMRPSDQPQTLFQKLQSYFTSRKEEAQW
jgi:hypothetical protein